ncbi:MAG: GGDEF domain-containing protein [Cyanobacteria bacterium P01_A01_bin.123]
MEALLLLVGDSQFTTGLVTRIQHHSDVQIITAETQDETEDIFKDYSPSVLVLQADYPLTQELCLYLKQTRDLAWIYCLVIELRDPINSTNWEKQAMGATKALKMGADVYLTLSPQARPSDEQLLQAQLAAALRHAKLYQTLTRTNNLLSAIALSDALTQINNRRAFDWELPRQIRAAQEKNFALSLMVIDIDHFKIINDTYGHLIGDKALKILAERLQYNMRDYDTPYRYGGEEFVVVLNHTSPEEAKAISQRMRQTVSDHPLVINDTVEINLTVSIGVASLTPEDDSKGMSLLNRADQGLLAAKSAGRNQVRFESGL